jgi:hypothetical protein
MSGGWKESISVSSLIKLPPSFARTAPEATENSNMAATIVTIIFNRITMHLSQVHKSFSFFSLLPKLRSVIIEFLISSFKSFDALKNIHLTLIKINGEGNEQKKVCSLESLCFT